MPEIRRGQGPGRGHHGADPRRGAGWPRSAGRAGAVGQCPVRRTPADWALQWIWNQPEVSVVLSSMSTLEQIAGRQDLASADRSGVGALTADDLALVDRVREAYRALCPVPCTACKYCLPCPNEVNIPEIGEMPAEDPDTGVAEEGGRGAGGNW